MKKYKSSALRMLKADFCLLIIVVPIFLGYPHGSTDKILEKMEDFTEYDINGDGIKEIEYLKSLPLIETDPRFPKDKLVLILVEPRLLEEIPNSTFSKSDLLERLKTFKIDLWNEGYMSIFIEAKVYDGPEHQDGRTVLAIREFLKAVKSVRNDFVGTILVGSFPEAMIVNRFLWKRGPEDIRIDGKHFPSAVHAFIVPQISSCRADIVLADLDGNWHDIYEEGPKELESIRAIPDDSVDKDWFSTEKLFISSTYELRTETFEDFFWIKDDNYQRIVSWGRHDPYFSDIRIDLTPEKLKLKILDTERQHPEMNSFDKSLPSPIARPEIYVSRINARHIAVNPDPGFVDKNGKKFLDANGKPQCVETATPINFDAKVFWKRDAALERRILIDYFDRNHAFRYGLYYYKGFRTACVATDFGAEDVNRNYLMKASDEFGEPVSVENATLLDYVEWLKKPAVLRGIWAHANWRSTFFRDGYNVDKLVQETGGNPWRWTDGCGSGVCAMRYCTSFRDQMGTADLHLHRTIWENQVLKDTGANLFITIGCHSNWPEYADTEPYNYDFYGTFQNAEGILFYLNGVALMARGKDMNDTPQGFTEALGAHRGSHFGDGWKRYFEFDFKAANNYLKQPYLWSILGDWTIRLRYFPPVSPYP